MEWRKWRRLGEWCICLPVLLPSADFDSGKDAATNARGIPFAPFVDRVEDYVSTRADVEGALKSFQEMIS